MPQYKAPLTDMSFLLHDWLNLAEFYKTHGIDDLADKEVIDSVIAEGARFAEEVLSPLNHSGDEQGCQWIDGAVKTPSGFKEAYQQFIENGWTAITAEPDFGGQGFPYSMGVIINEMIGSSNLSWGMYPGLTSAAVEAVTEHASDALKAIYLPKMISGEWSGTMCLTEAHCGSDLGLLRTKALPQPDGSYAISGTKIFISAGEHDLTDNIIHLVLARLPDAPEGTKGISLFIVPKFVVNDDQSIGEANQVSCASIEHKMGLNGSATCVINFDNAKGFLVGELNKGLSCMFTMMNNARIGTAIQGIAVSELSFQGALEYAKDRVQMRALSGPKHPDKAADPIIVHGDVRRMLLTQKALTEGSRALIYRVATMADIANLSEDKAVRESSDLLLGFLTPICKAFMTENAIECTNLGIQVYGGHGYIKEHGMEHYARDARITTIYEGTTGIQSLDLLGRKVIQTQGAPLKLFIKEITAFFEANTKNKQLEPFIAQLSPYIKSWSTLTLTIGEKAMRNPDEIGCASYDYLMYSGYITLAYTWLQLVKVAEEKKERHPDFYNTKITTADFYFKRILPRCLTHEAAIKGGSDALLSIESEHFSF